MSSIFITGGAGFIGSNLVDACLARGHRVVAYDHFSTGQRAFLKEAMTHKNFTLIEGNVLDEAKLTQAMRGIDAVFHLSANADVRFGLQHPKRDLEQNTIATSCVLEAMRVNNVKRIYFSSTGSVYGEPEVFPTPEDAPFPVQTSLYAASKLASEAMITAYAEGYGFTGAIFRFVSVLGERYTHGHVFDFVKQLRANPNELVIQGNGKQRKSYMYVGDCVRALVGVMEFPGSPGWPSAIPGIAIFNLGSPDYVTVDQSASWIAEELGCSPNFTYTGGERGWIGDSPFIFLDTKKIQATGWRAEISIEEAVKKTVRWLVVHPEILDARA